MIKIVVDTNIVVSALLSAEGNPAKIMSLITSDENVLLFYSTGILDEYRRVLSYSRLNIAEEKQGRVILLIEKIGTLIEPPTSSIHLPDESDRIFYDTAEAIGAILITGNTKHYPAEDFIMTPSLFLEIMNSSEFAL